LRGDSVSIPRIRSTLDDLRKFMTDRGEEFHIRLQVLILMQLSQAGGGAEHPLDPFEFIQPVLKDGNGQVAVDRESRRAARPGQ